MDSQKVYESIVVLLNNLVKTDKLKYWLYKNEDYKKMAILLVNDLITLEKEHDASYQNEQWGTIFAKALVIIIGSKQRFERLENRSIDAIYKDYSDFISYTNKNFNADSGVLQNPIISLDKETILLDAKLSGATIQKFDQEEERKEQERIKVEEEKKKKETQKETPNQNSSFNQNAGAAGAGFGAGTSSSNQDEAFKNFYANMPESPMANPRFYPYKSRPKWMVYFKWTVGIFGILAAIILIIADAYAISITFKFSDTSLTGMENWKFEIRGRSGSYDETLLTNIPIKWRLNATTGATASAIFGFILYIIPAVWLGYKCFSKPKNNREKYRVSYGPLVLMIMLYAVSITTIYQFASIDTLESSWQKLFKNALVPRSDYDSNVVSTWFNQIVADKPVKAASALIDTAIGFLAIAVILCIVTLIINPHLDREKVSKAQYEYQMALSAMMQGQTYQMDPSLFDNDDDVIIRNKSKVSLWFEKTFKRKNKPKKPKDSKKKNDKEK